MKYRKYPAILLVVIFVLSCLCQPLAASTPTEEETLPTPSAPQGAIFAQPFDVSAEAVYMVNLDTGLVMYDKNAEQVWSPASLTKMMTAILVVENVQDLDGTQVAMPRYVQDILYGTGSSTADIRPGESLSVRQLLYALLVPSANEASLILADYVGGGNVDNFVFMMNAKAAEIGCTNTNFTNPHGLYDANQYTTAYDQYLIARYIYENHPEIMEIVRTNTYELPENPRYPNGWIILNTNKMQMTAFRDAGFYREYIQGIKTGSLPEAGHNFASAAVIENEHYIMVVLGASGGNYSAFEVTAQLYDWAFYNFSVKPSLDITQPVAEVNVRYSSEADTVLLYPEEDFLTILPNESDETTLRRVYNLPESVPAPIQEGDRIGTVTLYLAGQEIGTVPLVARTPIKRNFAIFVVAKTIEFAGSLYFRVVLVLVVLVIGAYVYYMYRIAKRDEAMQKIKRRKR
jgi:D-alanyl-D-alanine carboxypeptidase